MMVHVPEEDRSDESVHLSDVESIDRLEMGRRASDPKEEVAREKASMQPILLLKLSVLVVLIVAASTLASLAYIFINDKYQEDFLSDYQAYANQIEEAFVNSVALVTWTAHTISVEFTSQFGTSDIQVWPNVTLSNFQQRTIGASHITSFEGITFSPLVTNDDRAAWEQYAVENQHQLSQNNSFTSNGEREVSLDNPGFPFDTTTEEAITSSNNCAPFIPSLCRPIEEGILTITDTRVVEPHIAGPGPFFPVWQTQPPITKPRTMLDLASFEYSKDAIAATVEHGRPTISWSSIFLLEPQVLLFFPVFGSFSPDAKVVGLVTMLFKWSVFFKDILHHNVRGLVVVVKNTCGQSYTFELNGRTVAFLGAGDLHDTKYDGVYERTTRTEATVPIAANFSWSDPPFSNSGDPDQFAEFSGQNHSGFCEYSVHVYVSDTFESLYYPTNPVWYSVGVALIFLFTAAVFLVYDCLVERRQKSVARTAERSNAIVRQLFPAGVRDRMLQDNPKERETKDRNYFGLVRTASSHSFHSEPRQSLELRRSFSLAKIVNGNLSLDNKSAATSEPKGGPLLPETPKLRLKSFLSDTPSSRGYDLDSAPIAEMFTDTTIMFGDIAGFTAWSSEREPSQVFVLLETLYRAFDRVAHKLGVFKVETIGDCYVAVTGLPDPNEHHAVVMTCFAYECHRQMKELVRDLEATLGPGTSDLHLRVGLHSGPVTAGVLRGEKSRFQLFGDSVNTAARMESTGEKNLIHASRETADILVAEGKLSWVTPRDDVVTVKGKGEMQTYWLKPRRGTSRNGSSSFYLMDGGSYGGSSIDSRPRHNISIRPKKVSTKPKNKLNLSRPNESQEKSSHGKVVVDTVSSVADDVSSAALLDERKAQQKRERLVDWNVDLLLSFLDKVVAYRNDREGFSNRRGSLDRSLHQSATKILDEVTEIILMPDFDAGNLPESHQSDILLIPEIREQLHDYVTRIADMYTDHPFHNLEHASHVTMSAVKLMRRIINPDDFDAEEFRSEVLAAERTDSANRAFDVHFEKTLHESTFGISSDPLTQFCVVFSALIHDVDHPGVPNTQLVKENAEVALKFGGKSTAEQNSVYIAWEMLMEPEYDDLRACIYTTELERKRFRQLVVNTVMATDIMDRELQTVRKNRWEKAFNRPDDISIDTPTHFDRSRKATSLIEHIIQASDVAHTMQHWHIFKRWNERLFDELYTAYKEGRTDNDPSIGWYEGQISFFDNYVIPLAKKLQECGSFGVAGAEYLSYALENRREWELKGKEESEVMFVNHNLKVGLWTTSTECYSHDTDSIPEGVPVGGGE